MHRILPSALTQGFVRHRAHMDRQIVAFLPVVPVPGTGRIPALAHELGESRVVLVGCKHYVPKRGMDQLLRPRSNEQAHVSEERIEYPVPAAERL